MRWALRPRRPETQTAIAAETASDPRTERVVTASRVAQGKGGAGGAGTSVCATATLDGGPSEVLFQAQTVM